MGVGCRQLVTPGSQDRCFFREMSLPVPGAGSAGAEGQLPEMSRPAAGFLWGEQPLPPHGAVVRVCDDDGKAPQMDTVCRWALWVTLLVFRKSCQLGARHVGEGPFLWRGGPG